MCPPVCYQSVCLSICSSVRPPNSISGSPFVRVSICPFVSALTHPCINTKSENNWRVYISCKKSNFINHESIEYRTERRMQESICKTQILKTAPPLAAEREIRRNNSSPEEPYNTDATVTVRRLGWTHHEFLLCLTLCDMNSLSSQTWINILTKYYFSSSSSWSFWTNQIL
jgi:hypothetical protein